MTDCRFCGRQLFTVFDRHGVCAAEWNRRYYAGTCIKCGGRGREPEEPYCVECHKDGDSPYTGYPQEGD